jgi:hypothetical protein
MDRRLARMVRRMFEDDLRSTTPVTLDEWQSHVLGHLLYLPLIPFRDQM